MAERLDFNDINNSIFLSQPCNRELAAAYVQKKILDMARIFPEIQNIPLSQECVGLCDSGEYDPLEQVENIIDIVSPARAILMNRYPQLTWEELKKTTRDKFENKYFLIDAPQQVQDEMIYLDTFFTIYDTIIEGARAMREEYSKIVEASKLIGEKKKQFPIETLLDSSTRDEVTTLAFQDRKMAEDCLGKLFFHYEMLKLIRPISQYVYSGRSSWKDLQNILENLPVFQIADLLNKNSRFAAMEADRLYGSDTYLQNGKNL